MASLKRESKVLFGRRCVRQALREHTILKVYFPLPQKREHLELLAPLRERRIPVDWKPPAFFKERGWAPTVVCELAALSFLSEEELLAHLTPQALLLALDGITDVGNFSSILRSSYYLGASGVIVRKKRTAPCNERVLELSRGAAAHIPIVRVGSLREHLLRLKRAGVCTAALSPQGDPLPKLQLHKPLVFILGDEKRGISRPILKLADVTAAIPQAHPGALNVAVACGIALFWSSNSPRHLSPLREHS